MYETNSTLITNEIDGQTLLMSTRSGEVVVLNEIGSFIWEALQQGHNEQQISALLASLYDVTLEKATQDVANFVAHLCQQSLIVPKKGPVG